MIGKLIRGIFWIAVAVAVAYCAYMVYEKWYQKDLEEVGRKTGITGLYEKYGKRTVDAVKQFLTDTFGENASTLKEKASQTVSDVKEKANSLNTSLGGAGGIMKDVTGKIGELKETLGGITGGKTGSEAVGQ